MSSLKTKPPVRPAVLEEAAGWLIEFRSGDPQPHQRHEFDHWLRTSPEHVRAYLTLLPTWENSAQLDPTQQPSAATLMQWARNGENNIVQFDAAVLHNPLPPPRNKARFLTMAAAALIALVTGTYFGYSTWQNPTYATGTGEQRSLTLPDGSTAELNSRSRLRIRFTGEERTVELLEGQALFSVAKNPTRPFIVHSGPTRVRAVGTQFDVYRKHSGTIITVIEGRVAVLPGTVPITPKPPTPAPTATADLSPPPAAAIYLSAGEQVIVTRDRVAVPGRTNLATATAWTQRRLIFSATPLPEVAEEFNRHNTRHLIIEDPALKTFRINGVFSSTDPAALIGFLHDQPGIVVTEAGQDIHVSQK